MDSESRDEMLALYSACLSEIAWFKSQQWQVAYYALAAQGAIVVAMQLLESRFAIAATIIGMVVCIASIWAGTYSVLILRDLDAAVEKSRRRLAHVRESFSENFRAAFTGYPSGDWESKRRRPPRLMQ